MLKKVAAAASILLPPGEPLLIGVSGGADSVALLHALLELGYRPHVGHLNHQWRGADSDADAEFVRELATRPDLPVTVESCRVEPSENAARQARLDFFQRLGHTTGISTLVLAHTADDQVETLLMRLLRGTGGGGLTGMHAETLMDELRIVRPMLEVTRAEVLEFLHERGLAYREDASNADVRFLRNRIRHELLPLLEREYSPTIRDSLRRTAAILREDESCLTELARPHVTDALHVPTLQGLPVALQRRVVRLWLKSISLNFDHVESVRGCVDEVHLPGGWVVYREYDWLRKGEAERGKGEAVGGEWPVRLEGETVIEELGIRVIVECTDLSALSSERKRQSGDKSPHSMEVLDAEALGPTPHIRTWREGDRFQPLGMAEEKKLQDFFVDQKVPRRERQQVSLLCASDGRIAWVVGYRMADSFKVTTATTRVARFTIRP